MTNFRAELNSLDYDLNRLTVKVPLLWLIQNADDSCDGYNLSEFEGWQEMFEEKCSDTGFGHLVQSIMDRGFMTEGAIGFNDGRITEGHHRLCAAILLGLDEVYVTKYGRNVSKPVEFGSMYAANLVCAHYAEDGMEELPIEVTL